MYINPVSSSSHNLAIECSSWFCSLWFPLMMMSTNGDIFGVTGRFCAEFTGHQWIPHKGQWRGALIFSLICAWINGLVSNHEAGDLRWHRAQFDVTVMCFPGCWGDMPSGVHSDCCWTVGFPGPFPGACQVSCFRDATRIQDGGYQAGLWGGEAINSLTSGRFEWNF